MSVTEKCKRLISGALSLILALGMCSGVSVQGHGPVAGTFSGSNAEKTVRFSAHFEKTDAAQEAVHQTLDNAQQSLIDAFGREAVQIDEEGMKP